MINNRLLLIGIAFFFSLCAIQGASAMIVHDGLVLYLNGTNDLGKSLYDWSGQKHNGTAYGTSLLVLPGGAHARRFNGTTDYVIINSSGTLNYEGRQESFGIFFNTLTINTSQTNYLITKYYTHQSIQVLSSAKIKYSIAVDGTTKSYTGKARLSDNTDYSIYLTYDGSHLQGYVNGVADGAGVNYTARTGLSQMNSKWYIGRQQSAGGNARMDVYSAAVYNRSLTAGEVRQNYLEEIKRLESQLISEFSASTAIGAIPLAVNFTDASTGDPQSWHWDFGDGNTSIGRCPSHVYNSSGAYNVSLTTSNAYGTNTRTRSFYIIAYPDETTASHIPATATVGLNIYNPFVRKAHQYKADLHVHTNNSLDARIYGQLDPAGVAAYFRDKLNFSLIALTDHDYCTPGVGSCGIATLEGIEQYVNYSDSTGLHQSHMNGVNVSSPAMLTSLEYADPQTFIYAIHSAGGLAMLNHPNETITIYTPEIMQTLHDYDLIEGVDWHVNYAWTHGEYPWIVGDGDCHNVSNYTATTRRNMVNADNASDIWDQIMAGNMYETQGPLIDDIRVTGNVITVSLPDANDIRFYGGNYSPAARYDNTEILLQTNKSTTTANYTVRGDERFVRVAVGGWYSANSQPILVYYYQGSPSPTPTPAPSPAP